MPSAELFLRLLEEKDLVSPQVLQAARREFPQSSPPPDAIQVSLWLVQGHHITANQAERLLAAVAEKAETEKAEAPGAKPLAAEASQPKAAEPQRAVSRVGRLGSGTLPAKAPERQSSVGQAGKPDVPRTARLQGSVGQAGKPDVPKTPAPRSTTADDDLDLAPLAEETISKPSKPVPAKPEPAKSSSPPKDASPSSPRATVAKTAGDKKVPAGKSVVNWNRWKRR